MSPLLLIVPAALSVPALYAGHTRRRGQEYIKTAVTLSLVAIVLLHGHSIGWTGWTLPFGGALLLAAVADFLLARRRRPWYFYAGATLFLVAYAVYGALLHSAAGPTRTAIVIGIILAAALVIQYRTLGPKAAGQKPLLVVYLLVISHLVAAGGAFAAVALADGRLTAAVLAAVAVVGIYFSDSCIGHNEFRRPLKYDELLILPSYFLAQLCMTALFLLAH